MSDRSERFIVVQQRSPMHFQFCTDPLKVVALSWEVIDRGPEFKVWGSSLDKVIARFATEAEASALRRSLIGD